MVSRWANVFRTATLLAASLPAAHATGAETLSVLPVLFWEEETESVLVAPPAEVAAWIHGDIDDPDVSLECLAEAYEWRARTPAFRRAVGELQRIVRVAREEGGLTASEINLGLIPAILDRRDDLRDALLDHSPFDLAGPFRCCEEWVGELRRGRGPWAARRPWGTAARTPARIPPEIRDCTTGTVP